MRTSSKEETNDLQVPPMRREHEGGLTVAIERVDVGSGGDLNRDRRCIASHYRTLSLFT